MNKWTLPKSVEIDGKEYEINKFDKANVDYKETNQKTAMEWLKFFP